MPIQFLFIMLHARLAKVREEERGASAVEWVIITAILVIIATALGATIKALIDNKASTISL